MEQWGLAASAEGRAQQEKFFSCRKEVQSYPIPACCKSLWGLGLVEHCGEAAPFLLGVQMDKWKWEVNEKMGRTASVVHLG